MHYHHRRKKGLILLLVSGLSISVFAVMMLMLFIFNANLRQVTSFKERTKAYYLCETGASVAILDIANGKIGTGQGQRTEWAFPFTIDGRSYPIHYKITKQSGQWHITSWIDKNESGFSRTYKLHVGGTRAFPFFIRGGFPGK